MKTKWQMVIFSLRDLKNLKIYNITKVMRDTNNKWVLKDLMSSDERIYRYKKFGALGCGIIIIVLLCAFAFHDRTHDLLKGNSYEYEEFNLYLKKYYRDIEFFGINKAKSRTIIIRMAPMQYFEKTNDYHGISFGYGNDELIEIYINEDSWKKFSKPQRYWLMYHELSHDILNVDDEPEVSFDMTHLMCPIIDTFNKVSMDDFIEASHELFVEYNKNK